MIRSLVIRLGTATAFSITPAVVDVASICAQTVPRYEKAPRLLRQKPDAPMTYAVPHAPLDLSWLQPSPRPSRTVAQLRGLRFYDGLATYTFPPPSFTLPACVYTMDAPVTTVSTNVEC